MKKLSSVLFDIAYFSIKGNDDHAEDIWMTGLDVRNAWANDFNCLVSNHHAQTLSCFLFWCKSRQPSVVSDVSCLLFSSMTVEMNMFYVISSIATKKGVPSQPELSHRKILTSRVTNCIKAGSYFHSSTCQCSRAYSNHLGLFGLDRPLQSSREHV